MNLAFKTLPLIRIGSSFITSPISLECGDYYVQDFIVADRNGKALAITPKQGSALAQFVETPAPILLLVSQDVVTKLVPEVVATAQLDPISFGYTTFSFTVKEAYQFKLGVFALDSTTDNFTMINSSIRIQSNGADCINGDFPDSTLTFTLLKESFNDSLNLYVSSKGRRSISLTMSAEELSQYYNPIDKGGKGVLTIVLPKY